MTLTYEEQVSVVAAFLLCAFVIAVAAIYACAKLDDILTELRRIRGKV